MNYCGFNIEPFCCDVCGDLGRPQTLVEIHRNMDISCGFRAVAAREKYPGLILLQNDIAHTHTYIYIKVIITNEHISYVEHINYTQGPPSWASYGMSIVDILEKIEWVIMEITVSTIHVLNFSEGI